MYIICIYAHQPIRRQFYRICGTIFVDHADVIGCMGAGKDVVELVNVVENLDYYRNGSSLVLRAFIHTTLDVSVIFLFHPVSNFFSFTFHILLLHKFNPFSMLCCLYVEWRRFFNKIHHNTATIQV